MWTDFILAHQEIEVFLAGRVSAHNAVASENEDVPYSRGSGCRDGWDSIFFLLWLLERGAEKLFLAEPPAEELFHVEGVGEDIEVPFAILTVVADHDLPLALRSNIHHSNRHLGHAEALCGEETHIPREDDVVFVTEDRARLEVVLVGFDALAEDLHLLLIDLAGVVGMSMELIDGEVGYRLHIRLLIL